MACLTVPAFILLCACPLVAENAVRMSLEIPSQEEERMALLVSVNNYDAPLMADLAGPNRDMDHLANALITRYRFKSHQIVRLRDKQAGRKQILAALESLAKNAKPDQFVVFAFAGHGSLQWSKEDRESNGMDETICPSDRGVGQTADILDDQLHEFFARILARGAWLTVWLDCCHSGGLAKPGAAERVRFAPALQIKKEKVKRVSVLNQLEHERFICITATSEEEKAIEAEYPLLWPVPKDPKTAVQGWFTHQMLRVLLAMEETATWRSCLELLNKKAKARQHPQLLGNADLKPFQKSSGQQVAIQIERVEGKQLYLNRGLASGLKPGMVLAVERGQGLNKSESKGWIRISSSNERSAIAEALEQEQAIFLPGNRLQIMRGVGQDFPSLSAAALSQPYYQALKEILDRGGFPFQLLPQAHRAKSDFYLQQTKSGKGKQIQILGAAHPIQLFMQDDPQEMAKCVARTLNDALRWRELWELHFDPYPDIRPEMLQLEVEQGTLVEWERFEGIFRGSGKKACVTGASKPVSLALVKTADSYLRLAYRNLSDRPLFVSVLYLSDTGEIFLWNGLHAGELLNPHARLFVEDPLIQYKNAHGFDRIKVILSTLSAFDASIYLPNKAKAIRESHGSWASFGVELTQPRQALEGALK